MKRIPNQFNTKAFTLIELLTVIAIISVLVGIMAIGMRKATITAKNLRQKAELKAMDIGLELFSKDFDGYPFSNQIPVDGGQVICGAQRMAEALVGRDGYGVEPQTGWYPPNDKVYNPLVPADLYDASVQASLRRRKGPFVEFKYSGIYTIQELWGGSGGTSIYPSIPNPTTQQAYTRSPVITDVFNKNQITINSESVKVGLPVLYYRANEAKPFRIDNQRALVSDPTLQQAEKWVYNYYDNKELVNLPVLSDPSYPDMDFVNPEAPTGTLDTQRAQRFYEIITQTAQPDRDYYKSFNANTFILISAGYDGVYGTKDDITNFNY
ncbi:MAG: prepilin-type N-terminal cleavage/methylation domain-containing protein [Sedimentisphaerales bacterium]|nr:prepilin-type N-terminal cleavage/methylation domain-containing protein [Sedimentisphaerales bacterium]